MFSTAQRMKLIVGLGMTLGYGVCVKGEENGIKCVVKLLNGEWGLTEFVGLDPINPGFVLIRNLEVQPGFLETNDNHSHSVSSDPRFLKYVTQCQWAAPAANYRFHSYNNQGCLIQPPPPHHQMLFVPWDYVPAHAPAPSHLPVVPSERTHVPVPAHLPVVPSERTHVPVPAHLPFVPSERTHVPVPAHLPVVPSERKNHYDQQLQQPFIIASKPKVVRAFVNLHSEISAAFKKDLKNDGVLRSDVLWSDNDNGAETDLNSEILNGETFPSSNKKEDLLGEGTFGTVKRVKAVRGNIPHDLGPLVRKDMKIPVSQKEFLVALKEVRAMLRLRDPKIRTPKIHAVWSQKIHRRTYTIDSTQTIEYYYTLHIVITELPGQECFKMMFQRDGNLKLRERFSPSDDEAELVRAVLFSQQSLLETLSFVHQAGVIHGDISARNIQCSVDDESDELTVHLIDFGFARVFDPTSVTASQKHIHKSGTYAYADPQIRFEKVAGADYDLYSCGVIMYENLHIREYHNGVSEKSADMTVYAGNLRNLQKQMVHPDHKNFKAAYYILLVMLSPTKDSGVSQYLQTHYSSAGNRFSHEITRGSLQYVQEQINEVLTKDTLILSIATRTALSSIGVTTLTTVG